MTFKTVVDLFDLLDDGRCDGKAVVDFLRAIDPDAEIEECRMAGEPEGSFTDFIRVTIPGRNGKLAGGSARTIGLIGRLGGIGARPARQGFVSDGDGALAALGCAAKLLKCAIDSMCSRATSSFRRKSARMRRRALTTRCLS